MERVGMRELRHRLREYLARVEAGDDFEVTVFGRPVAHLRPVAGGRRTLVQLIADGRVTAPLNPDTTDLPAPSPANSGLSATDALLAERRGDSR